MIFKKINKQSLLDDILDLEIDEEKKKEDDKSYQKEALKTCSWQLDTLEITLSLIIQRNKSSV